jgi:cytochrome d ubiquinol oxidase subunit II
LSALVISAAAGFATLALAARGAFGPARATAAIAVAAIVAGWGLAQRPLLLRSLTIQQAAAPHSTLVALLVGVGVGAIVLVPSLALLFWLLLTGRFDPHAAPRVPPSEPTLARTGLPPRRMLAPIALSCFASGTLLLNYPDHAWSRVAGVVALFGFVIAGFLVIALPN